MKYIKNFFTGNKNNIRKVAISEIEIQNLEDLFETYIDDVDKDSHNRFEKINRHDYNQYLNQMLLDPHETINFYKFIKTNKSLLIRMWSPSEEKINQTFSKFKSRVEKMGYKVEYRERMDDAMSGKRTRYFDKIKDYVESDYFVRGKSIQIFKIV